MSKLKEECGVFGIYSPYRDGVAASAYYALFALQHRGQQSCGIVVNDNGEFHVHKDVGTVNEVFNQASVGSLGQGTIALGHVRYGKAQADYRIGIQPAVINHIKGRMAVAFNGNITNSFALRQQLELQGSVFHNGGDAEIMSFMFIRERMVSDCIENAICNTMCKLQGAYSLVVMTPTKLIAVRDPQGFRPLCYGITKDGCYVVASESCALSAVAATLVRDVLPGEIIVFDAKGVRSITTHCDKDKVAPCVFEYIYFARPDSVIDGISVQEARLQAGAFLAESHPADADVVIGVPDSGIDAAMGYARQSGIPYGVGLIKNRYIGRTFIAPSQSAREDLVKIKLSPIFATVKNKRIVLIDDSIVRGTTSKKIVKLLREAGAKEIHMRLASPPFLHPCYYGTDIESRDVLIANNHSVEEIAQLIGVDSLGYLSIEQAKQLVKGSGCCVGCFSGEYPTQVGDYGISDATKSDKKEDVE